MVPLVGRGTCITEVEVVGVVGADGACMVVAVGLKTTWALAGRAMAATTTAAAAMVAILANMGLSL